MRRPIILILLVSLGFVFGQSATVKIDPKTSYVSYTGRHVLHSWTGTSHNLHVKFLYNRENPSASTLMVEIPIISFDSKNSNRDSNMAFVLDELTYPTVKFESKTILPSENPGEYIVRGTLYFHGISQEIGLPAKVAVDMNTITATSVFKVNLTSFEVKRPSLLLIPIDEELSVNVTLIGKIS